MSLSILLCFAVLLLLPPLPPCTNSVSIHPPTQVSVQLTPRSLCVSAAGDVLLCCKQLYAEIKVEDSTWFCGECVWCCVVLLMTLWKCVTVAQFVTVEVSGAAAVIVVSW